MSNGRIDLEACWQGAHEYPGFPLPQEALKAFVRLARAARAFCAEGDFDAERIDQLLCALEAECAAFTDSAEKP